MYNHNERIINNNNLSKVDNKFLDAIAEFIRSIESELDIMLYDSTSLRFLSHYKIIDLIISQKLVKNIIIRLLCPLDEDSRILTKQLVPFAGYKSVNITLPKAQQTLRYLLETDKIFFLFQLIHKDNNMIKEMGKIKQAKIPFFLLMTGCIQKMFLQSEI